MCKIRAYRHRCTHTSFLHLSRCRGTYASPSTKTPLCNAAPSLTVSLPEVCRACQYQSFCSSWESRIDDARNRSTAAHQMLVEADDDWSSCGEFCGGMDGMNDSPTSAFGDAELALRERRRSDEEVNRLWDQYQREQWNVWRIFVDGPSGGPLRLTHSKKRRTSGPRKNGSSPLREVTAADDLLLPEPLPQLDCDYGRPLAMTRVFSDSPSETSSDDSDSSTSTLDTSFGGWSSSSGFGGAWDDEDPSVFSGSWARDLEDVCSSEYDGMLPDYGMA